MAFAPAAAGIKGKNMRQFGIAASASLLLHATVFIGVQALSGDGSPGVALPVTVFDVSLVSQSASQRPRSGASKGAPAVVNTAAQHRPASSQSVASSGEHRQQPATATDPLANAAGSAASGTGAGAGEGAAPGGSGEGAAIQLATPLYRLNPPPPYPQVARLRRYEGVALLRVLVLADGTVGTLHLEKTSGYSVLDNAALNAVRSWAFAPGRRGGAPVAMEVQVPVRFALHKELS